MEGTLFVKALIIIQLLFLSIQVLIVDYLIKNLRLLNQISKQLNTKDYK